ELIIPDLYERLKDARPTSPFKTFRKTFATRRKFGSAARWPAGLIPIGDAMTSFNPTFGQGMTVAALQAGTLARLLAERAAAGGDLAGLAGDYFGPAEAIAGAAWSLATGADYAYPDTEGERPA